LRKKLSLLLSFVLLVATLSSAPFKATASTTVTPEAPAGWRDLLDYHIFKDGNAVYGWAGDDGFGLEYENYHLPVDTTVTLNGLPSIRLNSKTPTTPFWYNVLIVVSGWEAHDFTPYYQNGFLEFNVKGKVGGESFLVGFKDRVFERPSGNEITTNVNVSNYANITTDWTHVKIPLKDAMNVSQGIDPSKIDTLSIKNNGSTPVTFWLNDIKITSPDKERVFDPIKVNQLGYPGDGMKQALVTGFEDVLTVDENTTFSVKNAANNSTAFTGNLVLKKNYDAVDSGERVFTANFTSLNVPGQYYVEVQGLPKSPKFTIGNAKDLYEPFMIDAARYFYYQRTGIDISSPYTQNYQRTDLTPDTAVPFLSDPSKTKDVSKGWYDAGDKGKYVNAGAKALSDLFWAYEMVPEAFKDNQFNIPESGNGVPDLLDEARWELEWMLKMQDPDSGGFYQRTKFLDDDNLQNRIIYDKDTSAPFRTNVRPTADTATAAGALAHAYLLYKQFDPVFAQTCLNAAIAAWGYLEANPDNIFTPDNHYGVVDDTSNRLWAAGSLYRATGQAKYNNYFVANYTKIANWFEDQNEFGSRWDYTFNTAFFSYLKADNKDPAVVSWYATEFQKWFNDKVSRYNDSAWNTIVRNGFYIWGVTMQVADVPMEMIIGTKLLGTYDSNAQLINKITYSQLDWLLGQNPVDKSFITGYGEKSVQYPFSTIYRTDGLPGVPKGYMVGGPNYLTNSVSDGIQISRFPAKSHTDNFQDWTTNEHTIYWNSGLVFVAAYATKGSSVNSTISPTTAAFDKKTANQADITVTMTLNGNTFSGIKNGTATLVSGTDYTVSGNAVTLKKSYLAQQPVGTTNLNFLFSAGASATLTITVSDSTLPTTPTGLTATAGNAQAVLTWSPSTNATSYTVQRATVSGGPYTTVAQNITGTQYTDTGLTNGTTYYYVVKAVNAAGSSAASTQVSVTPTQPTTGSLKVQYKLNNSNATDNTIYAIFNIVNTGTTPVNISNLKLRYYFTKEGSASMNFWCDWAQIGNANVVGSFATINPAKTGADTYIELTFNSGAGTLAAGGQTGEIQVRAAKSNWSNFNETGDYSFDGSKSSFVDWNKVTLYQNNTLVWGIEP